MHTDCSSAFSRTGIMVMLFLLLVPSCLLFVPNPDTFQNITYIEDPSAYIFNLNICNDTVFMDSDDMIDFWMKMEGEEVDSVFIYINGKSNYIFDPDEIHSLDLFGRVEGRNKIQFEFIVSEPLVSKHYKTREMVLVYEAHMSSRFVQTEMIDGYLGIRWPQIQSSDVEQYQIERSIDEQLLSTHTSDQPLFTDDKYVGERATYRMKVKLKDGRIFRSYRYEKAKEDLKFEMSQDGNNGYTVKFEKSKYAHSFHSYYVTHSTGYGNSTFIYRSENINDTTIILGEVKFLDNAYISVYIPPEDILNYLPENGSVAYKHGHGGSFGLPGISYDEIVQTDQDKLFYIRSGKIYSYSLPDMTSRAVTVNISENFQALRATSGRDVIYAFNTNSEFHNIQTYFWSATSGNELLQQRTLRSFPLSVSDNLVTVQTEESNISPADIEIYDIEKGTVKMTIPYHLTSAPSAISPSGQYLLLNNNPSLLIKLEENQYNIILSEEDGLGYYRFVEFDPLSPSDIYMLGVSGGFVQLNIETKTLKKLQPIQSIINIDFFTRRVFGEGMDGIGVYDLDSGTLLESVNINEYYANDCILVGDRIFSGKGYTYTLN